MPQLQTKPLPKWAQRPQQARLPRRGRMSPKLLLSLAIALLALAMFAFPDFRDDTVSIIHSIWNWVIAPVGYFWTGMTVIVGFILFCFALIAFGGSLEYIYENNRIWVSLLALTLVAILIGWVINWYQINWHT